MCVVSMVMDHYKDKWILPSTGTITFPPYLTREEFEQLKKEVLEMKELLKKAKIYDEENNQPDCEMEEKVELVRKVAKLVGVELDDILNT